MLLAQDLKQSQIDKCHMKSLHYCSVVVVFAFDAFRIEKNMQNRNIRSGLNPLFERENAELVDLKS